MVDGRRVGLQSACDEIVAHRRTTGDRREDLLGKLLDARDEGRPLSDAEIRDQVLDLPLAGHETTSTAVTYALHLLGRHPEVQRQVRAEVAAIAVVRDLTARDAARLDYTTMTLRKTIGSTRRRRSSASRRSRTIRSTATAWTDMTTKPS